MCNPSGDADAPAMAVVLPTPTTELSEAECRAFDKLTISAYYDSNERSALSEYLEGTRQKQIGAIMRWIESEEGDKNTFLVLGQAGSGKTSLLNTIVGIQKGY